VNFFDFKDISERFLELLNPTSPDKVLLVGEIAGMRPGQRVVDFGTGFAEPLVLWAERFGIVGVGVELRPKACERARAKVAAHGLQDSIEIVCCKGADYEFEPHSFDVASCLGATFIWGGYTQTLAALSRAMKPTGRLVVGEPFWLSDAVPPDYRLRLAEICSLTELLHLTHAAGFDIEYMVPSSLDEWDKYEADNWRGLLQWIDENSTHPERQEVIDHLHETQADYYRYQRQHIGWAMYVLRPMSYR